VYEPITVEIDRAHGEGNYRSYSINFIGRLIQIVEAGHTTMRLYEWADLGRLLYLVHVEEDKPGRPPRRTLYPFINTHSASAPPGRDTPQGRYLGLTRNSPPRSFWGLPGTRANEVEDIPKRGSDIEQPLGALVKRREVLPPINS
jgi:hypothetical protein